MCVCVCVCVCMAGWMYGWMLVHKHLCMHVYIYHMYVCMYKECSATVSPKFKWGFCMQFGPNI